MWHTRYQHFHFEDMNPSSGAQLNRYRGFIGEHGRLRLRLVLVADELQDRSSDSDELVGRERELVLLGHVEHRN